MVVKFLLIRALYATVKVNKDKYLSELNKTM